MRRTGKDRAATLVHWLDSVIDNGSDRVLAFDVRTGRVAGELSDRTLAAGRHPAFADVAVAASARAHNLLLLTRNGRYCEPLGIAFSDPVKQLPS